MAHDQHDGPGDQGRRHRAGEPDMRKLQTLLAAGLVTGAAVMALPEASHGTAIVPPPQFTARATSTAVHVEVLEGNRPDTGALVRLVDAELGFSSAASATGGAKTQAPRNEMGSVVVPSNATQQSYASGDALDVAVAEPPEAEGQIHLAERAEARTGQPGVVKQLGDTALDADPLVYGDAIRSEAVANDDPPACTLGADLATGHGHIVDAQLLDQHTDAGGPRLEQPVVATDAFNGRRAVLNGTSRTAMVGASPTTFGVMAEARANLVPVTLFRGTAAETTIEVGGEWVLRATATGGAPAVHYGPDPARDKNAPLIRIIRGGTVTDVITAQNLAPLTRTINDNSGNAILELTIGEDPRPNVNGGWAVDVVRIRVLDNVIPGVKVGEVRIGHLEAAASLPEGAFRCPLDVQKSADPASVFAGQEFKTPITINNTYAVPLTNVTLTDTITETQGVKWTIVAASDGGTINGNVVSWALPDIPVGGSKTVVVTTRAESDSAAGVISDTAVAKAKVGVAQANGSAGVVEIVGEVKVDVDVDDDGPPTTAPPPDVLGEDLAKTGLTTGTLALASIGAVMVGSGLLLVIYLRLVPAVRRVRRGA